MRANLWSKLSFWQRGSVVIASTKEGEAYNLRVNLDVTISWDGKTYVEVEKHSRMYKGGRQGKRVTTMYRELGYTPSGDIMLGKTLRVKGFNVRSRVYWNEVNVNGRLDTGFEQLMAHFRVDGLPQSVRDMLRSKWELLNDTQKANVWNRYRKHTVDAGYGSSSISSRGAFMSLDVEEYAQILEDCINMELAE